MTTRLFSSLLAALSCLMVAACSASQPEVSAFKFDAAHSVALDAVVEDGRILTAEADDAAIEAEIREQLMYTIGQLNGMNGGLDMRRTEIALGARNPADGDLTSVAYTAKLFIAWPRELAFPATYQLVLPARGDWGGLSGFFAAYGSDESTSKRCLAWEAHAVSQSLLWYYYRPLKSSCPLASPALDDPSLVARATAHLQLSAENTSGKSPEYGKVWEDGRLVVTAIFGKYEGGATLPSDAGIAAYNETYHDLLASFGRPLSVNLPAAVEPGAAYPQVELMFETPSGPLDIHLYLVDGIRSVDADFRARYNARTQISDFVSYSGHSGLGANIRALARMGEFLPGQYQVFMVNGCDTFAYVDYALRDAHVVANPEAGPDKYFDIITNAMPSYFHMNSTSNLAVIKALIGKTASYRDILAGFDRSQRANVTGEQDNLWPAAFE